MATLTNDWSVVVVKITLVITTAATSVDYPKITQQSLCAVIVTHHPDSSFQTRLIDIAAQVALVIVVDNGSFDQELEQIHSLNGIPIHLILNKQNLGIATALNQGMTAAKQAGYQWAISFDQDSRPASNMIAEMLSTLNCYSNPEKVMFVGPNIINETVPDSRAKWLIPYHKLPCLFRRVGCDKGDRDDVTVVITSGALTNLSAFEKLGFYKDNFFVDYVDTEYCLRAKKNGYRILVSRKAILFHRFGSKRIVKVLGYPFQPTFHQPLRRYYICRNRISLLREYGLTFPHWVMFDMIAAIYNMIRILLCEDQRRQKVIFSLSGTWDGLCGRMGPMSVGSPRKSKGK